MTAILQIDPDLRPPLAHGMDSVVLAEADEIPAPLLGDQAVAPQHLAKLPVRLPHHGCHREVLEGPHGDDRLRLGDEPHGPPLPVPGLRGGFGGGLRRLPPAPGRRVPQRPRHRLLRGLGRVLVVVHPAYGRGERVHPLRERPEASVPDVPSLVRRLGPDEAGVPPDLVAVARPEQYVRNLDGGGGCHEPLGLELIQEVLNGGRLGDFLILFLCVQRVSALGDVDTVPEVGLADDLEPLGASRLDLVH
mmetsp:Transcript_29196/g.66518  ORF Transcript_29196/g.66518 Transcript_29196/m.66518 type:complete len:248 (+) Transcript_29196:58-801(+)